MTDKENYQKILDRVFGGGRIYIPDDGNTNNIIGALNRADLFQVFKKNFEERLVRLRDIYGSSNSFSHLTTIVKEVANHKLANYTGSYAELAAFDCMQNNVLTQPIEMDRNIAGVHTLVSKYRNRSITNADGYISQFDAYFDVKRLADVSKLIFDEIIKKAKEKTGISKYLIAAEYNIDDDYRDFERKFGMLLDELCTTLQTSPKTYQSKICNVMFRITDKGVVSTTSAYNHDAHAEHILHQIFKYADKFTVNNPFFLVMVLFPWYNKLITDFDSMNKKFYASLSEKIFNGYKGKPDLMSSIEPNYVGKETIFEVSQKLTGIIFVEDKSILGDGGNLTQTICYAYLNSNADNTAPQMQGYLQSLANSNSKGCLCRI